jgi:menaquinone-dependent protoporphyrinogen IX oxidase
MNNVEDLGRYDAAVLGSAVHGGRWLPAAAQFVERNAAVLHERPVWLFRVSSSVMRRACSGREWRSGCARYAKGRPKSPASGQP